MPAGGKRIALFNDVNAGGKIAVKELGEKGFDLVVTDNDRLRIAQYQVFDGGRVVRLHMMNKQVIELPSAQCVGDVFKKGAGHCFVHRVKKDGFVVKQDIGVIGYAIWYAVDALKADEPAVIGSDPYKAVENLLGAIHGLERLLA